MSVEINPLILAIIDILVALLLCLIVCLFVIKFVVKYRKNLFSIKNIVIVLALLLGVCAYKYVYTIEMKHRANYIILAMKEYRINNGHYPNDIMSFIDVKDNLDNDMMFSSDNIPGKGNFTIYQVNNNESILVVGGFTPPNILFFPNEDRKEINSYYFVDSSFSGIGLMIFFIKVLKMFNPFLWFIIFCMLIRCLVNIKRKGLT
jgi:hypothetical protein